MKADGVNGSEEEEEEAEDDDDDGDGDDDDTYSFSLVERKEDELLPPNVLLFSLTGGPSFLILFSFFIQNGIWKWANWAGAPAPHRAVSVCQRMKWRERRRAEKKKRSGPDGY